MPAEVTSAMIGSYAARLREGIAAPDGNGWAETPLANASVARAVIAVRSMHRFAAAEGLTDEDPARSHPAAEAAQTSPQGIEPGTGSGDACGPSDRQRSRCP